MSVQDKILHLISELREDLKKKNEESEQIKAAISKLLLLTDTRSVRKIGASAPIGRTPGQLSRRDQVLRVVGQQPGLTASRICQMLQMGSDNLTVLYQQGRLDRQLNRDKVYIYFLPKKK